MSANPVPAPATAPMTRCMAIDWLKAIGIIVVIWIHSFQRIDASGPLIIQRLGFLTLFAVPAFLFASGFLDGRNGPVSLRQFAASRVTRILVPYLLASVLAIGFRHFAFSESISGWQVVLELLTGGAWGIYYFVPILLGAAVAGQIIARVPSLVWPLFALFWVLGLQNQMLAVPPEGIYWQLRSPFGWWGYYFCGWVAARYFPVLQRLTDGQRRCIGAGALVIAGVAFSCYTFAQPPLFRPLAAILRYAGIYSIAGGLFLLLMGAVELSAVRWLSEATYPVYLYHFFIIVVAGHWPATLLRGLVAFALACAGSVLIVSLGRRVLGRQARLLIG